MKGKLIFAAWLVAILLVSAAPVAAQEEAVFLPGWVAWGMVVLALVVPVILYFYLRGRGRL